MAKYIIEIELLINWILNYQGFNVCINCYGVAFIVLNKFYDKWNVNFVS